MDPPAFAAKTEQRRHDLLTTTSDYATNIRDLRFRTEPSRATSVRRTKDVVLEMVEEYIDAVEKLQQVNEGATA